MMRGRSATIRRRRADSAPTTPRKIDKEEKTDNKRRQKKSVKWACELADQTDPEVPIRKYKSDIFIGLDLAMEKLRKVSGILDRSATLEKDFEENLQNIQDKLKMTEEKANGDF